MRRKIMYGRDGIAPRQANCVPMSGSKLSRYKLLICALLAVFALGLSGHEVSPVAASSPSSQNYTLVVGGINEIYAPETSGSASYCLDTSLFSALDASPTMTSDHYQLQGGTRSGIGDGGHGSNTQDSYLPVILKNR